MFYRVRNTHAKVFFDNVNTFRLYSYETLVCEINTSSMHIALSPAARCSRTTIRHLSDFLKQFNVSYQTAKKVLTSDRQKVIEHENGYTIYVSKDPRFKFHETAPFCLL